MPVIITVSPAIWTESISDCVTLAVTFGWGFPITSETAEQLYVALVPMRIHWDGRYLLTNAGGSVW